MKKILFLANTNISHLYPINGFIKELLKRNCDIYMCNKVENKSYIESMQVNFIEYPKTFNMANKNNDYIENLNKKLMTAIYEGNLKDTIYYFFKKDLSTLYNYNKDEEVYFEKIIKELKPDLIFCDSVNILGQYISKKLNKKVIGYITNNIYPLDNMINNNFYFKNYFLASLRDYRVIRRYIEKNIQKDFKNYLLEISNEIAKELNSFFISPYQHHNLNKSNYKNIVFSIQELQLNKVNMNEYNFILPVQNINNKKSKDEVDFINKNKNSQIIYIATGSFVRKSNSYYEKLIDALIKSNDIALVISWNIDSDYLSKLYNKYGQDKLLIKKYINQDYILSKCNLFITAGGFNSIIESIYNETPMLIEPISVEQHLNGIILERLNLARLDGMSNKSTGRLILELINNSEIKNSLREFKKILENNDSNSKINEFLDSINIK